MNITQRAKIAQIKNAKNWLLEEKQGIISNIINTIDSKSLSKVSNARNRIFTPLTTICTFVKQVLSSGTSSKIKQADSWRVYGRDLKAIDGTIITLPDTEKNNEIYPKHSNKNEGVGFPQIRLVGVLSLITGTVVDYALDANKGKGTGEISLLRRILDSINEQDIVVADRLYCNFF